MKKLSKKVISLTFLSAVDRALTDSGLSEPSKKTKKVIENAVEKISLEVQKDLKKSIKKVKSEKTKNWRKL